MLHMLYIEIAKSEFKLFDDAFKIVFKDKVNSHQRPRWPNVI